SAADNTARVPPIPPQTTILPKPTPPQTTTLPKSTQTFLPPSILRIFG
ncbi:15982_t:CDS:2, partial [Gigaspora rosea]